jgi:predicted amidohydrolase
MSETFKVACVQNGATADIEASVAEGGEGPDVILAEVDPARVAKARRKIPALQHARPFAEPEAGPARVAAAS